VLSVVPLYSKHARALTFEIFCQKWQPFDTNAATAVEGALQSSSPVRTVRSDFVNPRSQRVTTYEFDLKRCVQTNTATNYERTIRRIPPHDTSIFQEVPDGSLSFSFSLSLSLSRARDLSFSRSLPRSLPLFPPTYTHARTHTHTLSPVTLRTREMETGSIFSASYIYS